MRCVALLLALLAPCVSAASTRVLLIDDIGSGKPYFSWQTLCDGLVAFSVAVVNRNCLDDNCSDFRSTRALEGFKREAREVYYVGDGGAAPIACGKTQGFFLDGSEFYDACRVSVEPEQVCDAWYGAGNCALARTQYRVYLTIEP